MDTKTIYKKRTLYLLLVTVAALVVCAASLSFKQSLMPQGDTPPADLAESHIVYYSPNAVLSQENSSTTAAPAAKNFPADTPEEYLVTIYEGKIGVFAHGRTNSPPILTADVNVYLLPDEDIALLKQGFRVQTLSQVRALLEDYR